MAIRETVRTQAGVDAGLNAYMTKIFNYMTGGVALSGIIAWLIGTVNDGALMYQMITSGAFWVLLIAQLGLVFFLSLRVHKLQPSTALALFIAYSGLTGATLAPLVFAYTQASVVTAFLTAAAMFAGMSFIGYTTKKDLSGMGAFLGMGLIGLVVAMVVNIFLQSDQMSFIISLIAVPVFAGLTAWDMQKLKQIYHVTKGNAVAESRAAVMGALTLYLDFINLFIHLLRLMGDRR